MWRVLKYGGVPALLAAVALAAACGESGSNRSTTPFVDGGTGGSGGTGTAGTITFGGTVTQPPIGPCGEIAPVAPLTRWSIPDIDGTLDALFGPGTTLASVVTIDERAYQRDVSAAFVSALRQVATERVDIAIPDASAFEICAGDETQPSCLEPWLRDMGQRLYRRPLSPEQVTAYVAQFRSARKQRSPAESARNVLLSLILSPYSVFRVELGESADGQQLTPYEVAARLSHFATRRAPDPELLASAAAGTLKDPATIIAQLHRLWSTREGRQARSLQVLEWLGVSAKTLPTTLDADLRADMVAQTSALVDDVVETHSGSLNSLLTTPRQPLNARLAAHYGVPGPTTGDLQFVDTDPDLSAGLLSEGLFLASFPRPTLRGRAIVESLECQRLPEHPAQVAQTLSNEGTPRERIQQSTGNVVCQACHQLVDPIGFVLDGYDDQGRLTGFDTRSTVPNLGGSSLMVNFPRELGAAIAVSNTGQTCAAQRYLEYALDRPIADTITAKTIAPPGSQGAPLIPGPILDADHQWIECLVQYAGAGDFNLVKAAELIVAGSWLQRRAGVTKHFTAFDTSIDPVEHAYQEAAQFYGAFADATDNQTVQRYMNALLEVERVDALPHATTGDGGAGGDAAAGAPGTAGAP